MNVIKHDGSTEPHNLQKMRDSLKWSTQGIPGVSVSDIEMQTKLHMYDGIKTSYILDITIKTTYDMSSIRNFGYDQVSRNLKLQKLYKQVFNSTNPCTLHELLHKNQGVYSTRVLSHTIEELDILNNALIHRRDFTMTASGLDKTIGSDLIKNRQGVPIETPQFMFMLMAMDTFPKEIEAIIELYNALSLYKITLPTPELKALRTESTDYASCCALRIGDSLDSWTEGSRAIVLHTSSSAGVGVDISDISSIGDKVKNGEISHSGKIPILKSIDSDIGKASQNGRRGSATAFINFFDPEMEDILALKSPRTALDKRINDLSYGIKLNQLVYDRAKQNKPISLFSVRVAPQLNSLFYGKDINEFIAEYERLEAEGLYSSQISAQDLFKSIATERFETSAYYIINIDEINSNTPYCEEISQSNICVEFAVPTKPVSEKNRQDPAIGICVLGNINQGIVGIDELPDMTRILVRMQTKLAQRQNHPTQQANEFVKQYRDIGIGFSNHAYWLANKGIRYGSKAALFELDRWMEHFSFNLIRASCDLVQEFGIAPKFNQTSWSKGIMPIDRYNRNVDSIIEREPECDWDNLRKDVISNGMANCGLSMVPPSESSSIGSNQTSSLEPIRDLLTIKDRQGSNLKQYAPDPIRLADKYDFAFDRKINRDFISHVAIVQKWIDKSSSAGVFYNPDLYDDNKVAITDIISDMFYAKFLGCKTLYYQNTHVKDGNDLDKNQCSGGGCSV